MKCAKHILRYLKGTPGMGHNYNRDKILLINCDSDWGSDSSNSEMIIRYITNMEALRSRGKARNNLLSHFDYRS